MFVKLPVAAKTLGLTEYSLRRLIRKGLCPAVMVGGKYFLEPDEVKQHFHRLSLQNLRSDKDPLN